MLKLCQTTAHNNETFNDFYESALEIGTPIAECNWLEKVRNNYRDWLDALNDVLTEEPDDLKALQHTYALKNMGIPVDRTAAFAVQRYYFINYPNHGEEAGTWCRILVELEAWSELLTILNILKEKDDGTNAHVSFAFDS